MQDHRPDPAAGAAGRRRAAGRWFSAAVVDGHCRALASADRLDGEFAGRAVAVAVSETGGAWSIHIGDETDDDAAKRAIESCNDEAEKTGEPRSCFVVAERTLQR